ncbi:MAG: hypothetical protein BWY82_00267 [Verrucomicrobia bacterium ADurb.Bin474]|nr:MAG: hypothetical protein BWY82_00267 [Verrucomicrobia bacterium ADurb.Bin474]
MLAPFINIFQMVSISSPYSEESDGLGHERSRMAEAAADQYSTKKEEDG